MLTCCFFFALDKNVSIRDCGSQYILATFEQTKLVEFWNCWGQWFFQLWIEQISSDFIVRRKCLDFNDPLIAWLARGLGANDFDLVELSCTGMHLHVWLYSFFLLYFSFKPTGSWYRQQEYVDIIIEYMIYVFVHKFESGFN